MTLAAATFAAPKNASEVIPRLWQGGKPKPGRYSFDLIVLAAVEYQPRPPDENFPGAQVLYVPLPDDWRVKVIGAAKRAALFAAAVQAGETVAAWHRAGKAVLVTCGAGLNRSGLINGIALRNLGYSGDDAIKLILAARGPHALAKGRGAFAHFIRTYQPKPVASPPSSLVVPEPPRQPSKLLRVAVGAVVGAAVAGALVVAVLGRRRERYA